MGHVTIMNIATIAAGTAATIVTTTMMTTINSGTFEGK